MKKKIFRKATSLFLAFMFMLIPLNIVGVSAEDIVNVSVFDVIKEDYIIEEIVPEESIVPVEEVASEELIMITQASSPSSVDIDDTYKNNTMTEVAGWNSWSVGELGIYGVSYVLVLVVLLLI